MGEVEVPLRLCSVMHGGAVMMEAAMLCECVRHAKILREARPARLGGSNAIPKCFGYLPGAARCSDAAKRCPTMASLEQTAVTAR